MTKAQPLLHLMIAFFVCSLLLTLAMLVRRNTAVQTDTFTTDNLFGHHLSPCIDLSESALPWDARYSRENRPEGDVYLAEAQRRLIWIDYRPAQSHPLKLGEVIIALGSPRQKHSIPPPRNRGPLTTALTWDHLTVFYLGPARINTPVTALILTCEPNGGLASSVPQSAWRGFTGR